MKIRKVIIPLLLLFFYTPHLSAQDTVLTFYDKKGEIVKKRKKDGHYTKTVLAGEKKYIESFSSGDDKPLKKGFYKTDNDTIADGPFVIYERGFISEGIYQNNYKTGIWKAFYDNGQQRYEISFLSSTDSIEHLIKTDSSLHYLIRNEGGIYDGICKWYRRNGRAAAEESYKNGKLFAVSLWDTAGEKLDISLSEYGIQRMPLFQGSLPLFLKKNLVYPHKAAEEKKQGQAIITFVVDENGRVSDIDIKKSSGNWELDNAAMGVVEKTDGWWLPGTQHNLPVPVYYLLPVTFKL